LAGAWLAAVELTAGNPCHYIHYEEGDPGSTFERPRLPRRRPRHDHQAAVRRTETRQSRVVTALLQPKPTLWFTTVQRSNVAIGVDHSAVDEQQSFAADW
jgi:hypothetical protein